MSEPYKNTRNSGNRTGGRSGSQTGGQTGKPTGKQTVKKTDLPNIQKSNSATSAPSELSPDVVSSLFDSDLQAKLDDVKSTGKVAPSVLSLFTLLCVRISEQDRQISEQRERITELETECAKSDQYSRRSTIVVSGLKHDKNEKPDDLKRSVCNSLSSSGVNVDPAQLQACHRNQSNRSDPSKPPSITVRFYDFNLKDKIVNDYHNYDRATKRRRDVTVSQSLNYHFRSLKKAINEYIGSDSIRYIHYRSSSAGLVVQLKKERVISGEVMFRKIFCLDDFVSQFQAAGTELVVDPEPVDPSS